MASAAPKDGSAETAGLVTGNGRRDLFACKKGGPEVGKTKKGKGTKIMLMTDGNGVPTPAFTTSAQHAEVNTIETLADVQVDAAKLDEVLNQTRTSREAFASNFTGISWNA